MWSILCHRNATSQGAQPCSSAIKKWEGHETAIPVSLTPCFSVSLPETCYYQADSTAQSPTRRRAGKDRVRSGKDAVAPSVLTTWQPMPSRTLCGFFGRWEASFTSTCLRLSTNMNMAKGASVLAQVFAAGCNHPIKPPKQWMVLPSSRMVWRFDNGERLPQASAP